MSSGLDIINLKLACPVSQLFSIRDQAMHIIAGRITPHNCNIRVRRLAICGITSVRLPRLTQEVRFEYSESFDMSS
jgi:hypothetical protein